MQREHVFLAAHTTLSSMHVSILGVLKNCLIAVCLKSAVVSSCLTPLPVTFLLPLCSITCMFYICLWINFVWMGLHIIKIMTRVLKCSFACDSI